MATRLSSATFGYQNFYSATLSADITAGATSIGLSTVPTPTAGILVIEPDSTTNREVILYTSKGASTVTAPADGRGYSGTTAVSHLQGASVIMAPVDKWFTALASGELSSDPLRTELFFDYVASGCVWTADAAGSTKNASMTSGVIYILGKRLTLAAVTARVFTPSKDTYIDVSDNGDGTGLITYNEVTNNAASPALSTNNVRIGIIVTGAGNIAAAGSVNQGQEDRVLPIASSVAYTVTDSLGNLICPRDPNRKLLGYRQIVAAFTSSSNSLVDVTGLSCPVIVPTGRKVRVTGFTYSLNATTTTDTLVMELYDGAASGGTRIQDGNAVATASIVTLGAAVTPTTASKTYSITARNASAARSFSISAGSDRPAYVMVELI